MRSSDNSLSDNSSDEFALLTAFYDFLKYWWIAVLTTLVGGLIGFLFSRIHAPIYEATASITVNVDLSKVTKFPLERQDEELALYNIQVAIFDSQTIANVVQAANRQNLSLDSAILFKNQTVERKLVVWELRYRDGNPITAQKIANLWVDEASRTFQIMQDSGKVPSYVIIQGISSADVPQTPIYYFPSWLILAGGVIGLASGILIVESLGTRLQSRL